MAHRLTPDIGSGDRRNRHDGSRMNFHAAAPKIPPRILCIGMPVRDLTFRVQRRCRRAAPRRTPAISTRSAAATRSMPRSASSGSAAAPRSAARWAMPAKHRAAIIFEKLAHEGIDTKHLVHMPGLVTPISNIMIDPSGERTIVTFRDPELWKVHLPDTDDAAGGLRRHPDREPLRGILHRSLRRGAPARHSRGRRRRPRDVAARRPAHRVVASGVLQRAAAGDRRRRRRRRGAEEDREADAVVPGGHARRRRARSGSTSSGNCRRRRPSRSTPWIRWAPATCSMARSRSRSPKSRTCRQALRFASAAAALKCTRFGGAFAAPQRAEVEELLSQGQAAGPARTSR